jgi:hypothetical protein
MPTPLQTLEGIVAARETGEEYRWEQLLSAMRSLISGPPIPEVERLLVALLRFDGEIRLHPDSELPHSMPPEEMLKSLALQTLARWAGLTYLREMQRVQATAASPVLAGIARTVIQRASAEKGHPPGIGEVAEMRSETSARTTKLDYGGDWPVDIVEDEPGGRILPVARPVWRAWGMTYMPDRRIRNRKRERQLAG